MGCDGAMECACEGDLCNKEQKFVNIPMPYMVKEVNKVEDREIVSIYQEQRRERDVEGVGDVNEVGRV